ncbi:hypothetical protein ACWD01_34655 [Streptomyces sp. NPDC002835]|jgi:hypothetical protein
MQRLDLAKLLAEQAGKPPTRSRQQGGRQPAQLHHVRFQDTPRRARNLPRRSSY